MTIHIDIVAQLAEEISDILEKLNFFSNGFHFEVVCEDGMWKIKGYKVPDGESEYDPESDLVYEDYFKGSINLDAIKNRLAGLLVYAKLACNHTVDTKFGTI